MRRAALAVVALLVTVSLVVPPALANPNRMRPFQSAGSSGPYPIPCMSYNGMNDSYIPRIVSRLRIALIKPILTATPYSQYASGSFYAFYTQESGVTTNVTTNLNLLSTNVSSGYGYDDGWGLSHGTYLFFSSLFAESCGLQLGKNVQILTDMDVADGALFNPQSHTARFDVVVLPFSEYVEASEYSAYENFVAGGGTLVMMAHSLEYQVAYNSTTSLETLVFGHGWAFNGKYAYRIACGAENDTSCPWAKNSTDWVGSNSCLRCPHASTYNGSVVNTHDPLGSAISKEFGGTIFKSYVWHEEDTVTNMSGTSIVAVLENDSSHLIATYTHHFRKGLVVNFGFFGDDILLKDSSAQYLMLLGAALGRSAPTSMITTSSNSSSSTNSASSTISTISHGVSSAALNSTTTMTSSSTTTLASQGTADSSLQRAPTSAVAAPASPGAFPSMLAVLGGMAAVFIVAGAVVLRKRRAGPSG